MLRPVNLVIFNYSMSSLSQVFSHQRQIAFALSSFYEKTYVITAESRFESSIAKTNSEKLEIISTNWQAGRSLLNILHFYRVTLPVLFANRGQTVFSHMTEVQSLLIAPFCTLFGIKHFLWYAHSASSIYLYVAYPFLQNLITSTSGSCPIRGKKVRTIGQAIDSEMFTIERTDLKFPPKKWYHIGRIDPSKNIHLIIEVLASYLNRFPEITLDIYGEPSSELHKSYLEFLKRMVRTNGYENWVTFHGLIYRHEVREVASRHDGFIHAYNGSLDKAVVEAIFSKRVIVSSNPEYQREFLGLSNRNAMGKELLCEELTRIYSAGYSQLWEEIERSSELAERNHSLNSWLQRIVKLMNAENSDGV